MSESLSNPICLCALCNTFGAACSLLSFFSVPFDLSLPHCVLYRYTVKVKSTAIVSLWLKYLAAERNKSFYEICDYVCSLVARFCFCTFCSHLCHSCNKIYAVCKLAEGLWCGAMQWKLPNSVVVRHWSCVDSLALVKCCHTTSHALILHCWNASTRQGDDCDVSVTPELVIKHAAFGDGAHSVHDIAHQWSCSFLGAFIAIV